MSASLTMRTTGDDVSVRLRQMAQRAKNPDGVWPRIGSYLAMANRRQWATQGAYFGTPWKPLKPEYLQWKISHGYSRRTLIQGGDMRRSFTSRPMSIEIYEAHSAVYGSDDPLAKYHQHGTHRNGRVANPKRPMMKLTPKSRADIKQIMSDWVLGKKTSIPGLI